MQAGFFEHSGQIRPEIRTGTALEFPDNIQEHATIIEGQIPQIVGESSKIVACANLEVLADMTVDGQQSTVIGGLRFRHVQGCCHVNWATVACLTVWA